MASTATLAAQLRAFVRDGELHDEASALLGDELVLRLANGSEPTLLQLAAINGRVAMAEALLASGVACADAVCRTKGQTAAHIAAEWGYCELLELLVRRMMRVDVPDRLGHTPLIVAAANNEVAPTTLLLQTGACLGHQDKQGRQALHLAALNGHHAVIETLCHSGASPLATDKKGDTALDIIQRQERFYAGQQLDHPALERYRRCTQAIHIGIRSHDRLLERCGSVQAWQRLCWSQLPRRFLPSVALLKRVGEHLEALQLDLFLSGRIVLPVTARAGDPSTFFGEEHRMTTCRRHKVVRLLEDLGDSDLSAEEEERRAAAGREDAAIEASVREFSRGVKQDGGHRTLEEVVEAEYRAQQARRDRRLERKRAAERAFIATSSESEGEDDAEDALDRAERLLREGRRRPRSPSEASGSEMNPQRRKIPRKRRDLLSRARASVMILSSSESDDEP